MTRAASLLRSGLQLQEPIPELANIVAREGGRLLIVGGWVRDALLGQRSKDVDLEVFGLSATQVSRIVVPMGFTEPVGRQFPIWRHTGRGIDLALPRIEEGPLEGPIAQALPDLFRKAAQQRDLTINAIAWDPIEACLLDPLDGSGDLATRTLRAAHPESFGADPLRVLRVARFSALLEAEVETGLLELCRSLDLTRVPVERLAGELQRMLFGLARPSEALHVLDRLGHLGIFPPLAALKDVPQDPAWHPEGDVFVHTTMVIDQAALISRPLPTFEAECLLLAALCHDLGKPATTSVEAGRIRSLSHEAESARVTREWLQSLRFGARLISAVCVLVECHLAPSQFIAGGAGLRAYRRLARKLDGGGVTLVDLERLARADHLGRTTPSALAGVFEAGPAFLAMASRAEVQAGVGADVVSASFVMRQGIPAGPRLGQILERCRRRQDETGWTDEARILKSVLLDDAGEDEGGN